MRNKVVICCIVKDEKPFIKEWVDYHLSVGVSEIHIFEDFGSCSHVPIFQSCEYDNKVFITPLDHNPYGIYDAHSTKTQIKLYSKFFKWCKVGDIDCDWVLFVDVDEFLMFDDGWSLERLCNAYTKEKGVWLSWKMIGASGHIKSPHPMSSVRESYDKVANRVDADVFCVKSLVNVHLCDDFNVVHNVRGGVMTNGKRSLSLSNTKDGMSYDKAWINHYFTKSWEDYCDRIFNRGNMSNNYRSLDQFFRSNTEFIPMKEELVNSVRYRHTHNTMYLSFDMKLISGGNVDKLRILKDIIK